MVSYGDHREHSEYSKNKFSDFLYCDTIIINADIDLTKIKLRLYKDGIIYNVLNRNTVDVVGWLDDTKKYDGLSSNLNNYYHWYKINNINSCCYKGYIPSVVTAGNSFNVAINNSALAAAEKGEVKLSFSLYAKLYVEPKINEWQKKGEFEKIADWQKRVTPETRKAKIKELAEEAEKTYTMRLPEYKIPLTLGSYDSENETYLVTNPRYGKMLVSVPLKDAPQFKEHWDEMIRHSFNISYGINHDTLTVKKIDFWWKNADGTYNHCYYKNTASLSYNTAQINYNFDQLDGQLITSSGGNVSNGKQSITTSKITIGQSDIDINIPVAATKLESTFAVVIANENYQKEAKVPFALNDGYMFAEYCRKALGIAENNVHYVADATLNNIKYEINWLKQVIDAYKGTACVIFYYAGHGIPHEAEKTAYLLPIDGYGTDVTTGFKLDDLYAALGSLPSKSVTVFLDACFSGANRSGEMLASARGVAIKVKGGAPTGNMVVFSAAQGDETAYPNKEQQHGMFTYYLLKKIKDTKGEATYQELSDYITDNVRRSSIVMNGKSQTPVVTPAQTVAEEWKGWKLK